VASNRRSSSPVDVKRGIRLAYPRLTENRVSDGFRLKPTTQYRPSFEMGVLGAFSACRMPYGSVNIEVVQQTHDRMQIRINKIGCKGSRPATVGATDRRQPPTTSTLREFRRFRQVRASGTWLRSAC